MHISLFLPFRALSLDVFGLLRPIGQTVGLRQGYCAHRSVFCPFFLGFASRSVVFSAKLHFWTLWPIQALCLDLDRLIRPTLVHGSSHGKGRLKLVQAGFWCGRVLSQCGQGASRRGQDASHHMLQEGFGLSSSPGMRGRRAGRDVILPVV